MRWQPAGTRGLPARLRTSRPGCAATTGHRRRCRATGVITPATAAVCCATSTRLNPERLERLGSKELLGTQQLLREALLGGIPQKRFQGVAVLLEPVGP